MRKKKETETPLMFSMFDDAQDGFLWDHYDLNKIEDVTYLLEKYSIKDIVKEMMSLGHYYDTRRLYLLKLMEQISKGEVKSI